MNRNDGAVGDARKRADESIARPEERNEAIMSAIYDLIADHPMWIGDDGQPLDYLPEREARIADFLNEAAAAIAEATR